MIEISRSSIGMAVPNSIEPRVAGILIYRQGASLQCFIGI